MVLMRLLSRNVGWLAPTPMVLSWSCWWKPETPPISCKILYMRGLYVSHELCILAQLFKQQKQQKHVCMHAWGINVRSWHAVSALTQSLHNVSAVSCRWARVVHLHTPQTKRSPGYSGREG